MNCDLDSFVVYDLKVKFGVRVPNMAGGSFPLNKQIDFGLVKDVALECEALGYHSVWINDHVNKHILECWTTLSALATATETIRLGTQVICNTYRTPSLLAKMAATLDFISNGRLEFGIGAGSNWDEEEHKAYGIPFPKPIDRIRRMEEAIEIMKRLWTEDRASFKGRYYRINEAICDPKPVQKPHPPIMVGGARPRLLRAVAKYADRCNLGHRTATIESYQRTLQVLKKQCNRVGRDFDELEKSHYGDVVIRSNQEELREEMKKWYLQRSERVVPLQKDDLPFEDWLGKTKNDAIVGTPRECLEKIEEYLNLGVTLFVFAFKDLPSMEGVRLFAREIIPSL